MEKIYNVLLDTKDDVKNPAFVVNTNDLKTVKINLLINQDGDPLDLTGATVRLAVKKPDKTTVLQDITVVDALAGSCEIVLNTQAYVIDGKYDAEVMVYFGVDTVAVTGQFSYRAVKGILDDGTVESTNEWQSITQTLNDVQATVDDLRVNGTGIDAQARADLETVTTSLAESVTDLQVAIEKFPIVIPESNDSPRIQRAIDYCEAQGIGRLKAKGNYTLGASLNLPSNFIIEGLSPIKTKFTLLGGITAFAVNGKRNVKIKDLAIDGIGRTGTRAFYSYGSSVTISFNNVWIDSVEKGIETEYTFFVNLKDVRVMGTKVSFLFRNATNVVNMENCSGVFPVADTVTYSGFAVTAFNGSCLSIKGCSFEGEGGRINVYAWSGLSLDAVYHENQSGIQGDAWVTLGTGVGDKVKGASIRGCNYLGGFKKAVSVVSVEGLSIEGNTFDNDENAIEMRLFDTSPKKGIKIGENSYKNGIGKIVYAGSDIDNANSNSNSTQLTPLNFKKEKSPQPSHLENEDIVIFNDGKLKTTRKDVSGQTTTLPISIGVSGVDTLMAGQTSAVIPHGLEITPNVVLITPEGNVGNWWVDTRGNSSFKFHCSIAPGTNTSLFWFANKV